MQDEKKGGAATIIRPRSVNGNEPGTDTIPAEVGAVVIAQGKTFIGILARAYCDEPHRQDADAVACVDVANVHEVMRFTVPTQSALGRVSMGLTTLALPMIGLGPEDTVRFELKSAVYYEVPAKDIRALIDASRAVIAR